MRINKRRPPVPMQVALRQDLIDAAIVTVLDLVLLLVMMVALLGLI